MTASDLLSETGTVYVTRSALDAYRKFVGGKTGDEDARQRLTYLLSPATYQGASSTGAERWRARSRSSGLDLSATVVRFAPEDLPRLARPLAVVVALSVRWYD